MTPDELRAIMEFLRDRVSLMGTAAGDAVAIEFSIPTVDEMTEVGLDADGCRQILNAAWWDEMVTDIVETPEMSEPEDSPEQVLAYARDVVSEYIRKRATL